MRRMVREASERASVHVGYVRASAVRKETDFRFIHVDRSRTTHAGRSGAGDRDRPKRPMASVERRCPLAPLAPRLV